MMLNSAPRLSTAAALAASLIVPALALAAPKTKAKPQPTQKAPVAPKAPTVKKPVTKGPLVKKPTNKPKVKTKPKVDPTKRKGKLIKRPSKKKPDGGGGTPPPSDPPQDPPQDPPTPTPQNETGALAGLSAAHNTERALVGTAPLTWSPSIAGFAQQWAESLVNDNACMIAHNSNRGTYGENLFWTTTPRSTEYVVAQWTKEKIHYNADTHTCAQGQICGHYTQVVWHNTTEIGCGMATCGNGTQIWVCNYNPTGNYYGQPAF